MKPYQFIGVLGAATVLIGMFAVLFNDKTVGIGLITAGVSDIAVSVQLAQGTAPVTQ